MSNNRKTVYIAMSADIIHHGHINVIKVAADLGDLTVGILTNNAISKYKSKAVFDVENRKKVIEQIKGVENVIIQDTVDYKEILRKLRPDFVVHGDDWKVGILATTRQRVIDVLKEWGGKLVEVEYTSEIDSLTLTRETDGSITTSTVRQSKLRKYINDLEIVKVCEVHNGLSGLIAEKLSVIEGGEYREFDAMWSSSLTDSTAKGKPDIEAVDVTSRMQSVNQIFEVTSKPMIYDGDTGGIPEHFSFTVKTLERLGISAVVIEDKIGLKKNSLLGNDVSQQQDTIDGFCHKIRIGKLAQITNDFMIIARIESLILEAGMDQALERAVAYIDAGADGILIHSRKNTPNEIFEFCRRYYQLGLSAPVVVVPSSFPDVHEKQLIDNGINVVVYANQMLRAAYPAMHKLAESILRNHRSYESKEMTMSISDILKLVPGTI